MRGLILQKLSRNFFSTTASSAGTNGFRFTLPTARLRPADWAWTILAALVLAYELAAKPGELLSEGMYRYKDRHPIVTSTGIVYLALHLLRLWPSTIDPLHRIATGIKR